MCLAAVKALQGRGADVPAQRTTIHASNYEEVGHGAAGGFPTDLVELLTVDMAAIGDGQASDEFHCTLCVKDSGGPYHVEMNRKLRRLATENGLDASHRRLSLLRLGRRGAVAGRGGRLRSALVGPGVDASHSYERIPYRRAGRHGEAYWVLSTV